MNTIWVNVLVHIVVDVGTIISLVVSALTTKKTKALLVGVGVVLLLFRIVWDVSNKSSTLGMTTAMQHGAYKELADSTLRYMGSISHLMTEASDGWLPVNESEFFSPRSVNLLCRELNAMALAPTVRQQTMGEWFAKDTQQYHTVLKQLRRDYGQYFHAALINAIDTIEHSTVFKILQMRGQIRDPSLCLESDDEAEKLFTNLYVLVQEIRKGVVQAGFDVIPIAREFPLPRSTPRQGRSRLTSPGLSPEYRTYRTINFARYGHYRHGLFLQGNEFTKQSIRDIKVLPPGSYCKNAKPLVIRGDYYGVLSNVLTTGYENSYSYCNEMPIGFYFLELPRLVKVRFSGAHGIHKMTAYREDNSVIAYDVIDAANSSYQEYSITLVSSTTENIAWVKFETRRSPTLIHEIRSRQ